MKFTLNDVSVWLKEHPTEDYHTEARDQHIYIWFHHNHYIVIGASNGKVDIHVCTKGSAYSVNDFHNVHLSNEKVLRLAEKLESIFGYLTTA